MTTKFRAVLFDLDGTLLDSLQDIGDSVNRVLAARGCPVHSIPAYKRFVGDGVMMLIRRVLPEDQRNDAVIKSVLSEYRADYAQNWNIATRPYDGIPEMLNALAPRGLKLGVLSNKPHTETMKCVDGYFPAVRFATVLGHRDDVALKPDPAGAHEAARAMGVSDKYVLYVGDTAVDMETARAAGMFAVGVTWGFRTESELRAHGANAIANNPSEILRIIAHESHE